MAKTSVNNIVVRAKRNVDYDITDSDLDTIIIDFISDALKEVYQMLFDAGRYIDIGTSVTLTTTADQAYIDISSDLAASDAILRLSERTNDTTIQLIPYTDFVAMYTDPTADTSNVPDNAAIWGDRLYLGPTPTGALSIYSEYVSIPADVSSGGTMPYKTKYDPLILAIVRRAIEYKLDAAAVQKLSMVDREIERLSNLLIINATKDIGVHQGSQSRRGQRPYFSPRKNVN